jgi:hypothetical protein
MWDKALKYIEEGLVLDRAGKWIPLDDAIAAEDSFQEGLAAGNVLQDGKWVSIEQAIESGLSIECPVGQAAHASAVKAGAAQAVDLDTKAIDISDLRNETVPGFPAGVSSDDSEEGEKQGPDADMHGLSESDEQETDTAAEEYTPDTVRLEINLDDDSPELQGVLDPAPPLIDDKEKSWDVAVRKRRMLILISIGGVVVLAAGIILLVLLLH